MKDVKKKTKIARNVLIILLILLAIWVVFCIYYFIIMDRWSDPVIKDDMSYKIKTEQFLERNVFVVSPKDEKVSDSKKLILYMHGGAYVEEISPDYWTFIENIVKDTGATVVIPDYPLAPKYSYLDVFDMLEPLYKKMVEVVNPNNIILMGDSAGGGMALALLEELGEEMVEFPNQTILISPWLDVTMENPKIDEIQKLDTVLNKEVLRLAGIAYAKTEENAKNYLVSPIYGDLSKIKNVTIFTGTHDILNPDIYVLKENAEVQGSSIEIKEYEGAKHIWLIKNNTEESLTKQGYKDLIKKLNSEKG